jgi:selenide,water dikinase
MAQSSGVTVELFVGKLPLLPGASELAAAGNMTRASASNRNFTKSATRIDDRVDKLRLEFVFDAQTSGGLLISVPEDRADELVRLAKEGGAEATCVVGAVREKQEHSLVLLP